MAFDDFRHQSGFRQCTNSLKRIAPDSASFVPFLFVNEPFALNPEQDERKIMIKQLKFAFCALLAAAFV